MTGPIENTPSGGNDSPGDASKDIDTDVSAQELSKGTEKNIHVQSQQAQAGKTTKTDEEVLTERKENKDLERIRNDHIQKKSKDEGTQTTATKESRTDALNTVTPDKPKLIAYIPLSYSETQDENVLNTLTPENLDELAKKLGMPVIELTEKDLLATEETGEGPSQEKSGSIPDLPTLPKTTSKGQSHVSEESTTPELEPPFSEEALKAPAGQGLGGLQFYLSGFGGWKVALVKADLNLERENRNNMSEATQQITKMSLAGIALIKETRDRTIKAGKEEAQATRKQGEQALVGGIVSFGGTVVGGLGGGALGWASGKGTNKFLSSAMFTSQATGMGFKAGTEIGRAAGEAGSGGVSMGYSKPIAKAQIEKSLAEAEAAQARTTEQMIGNSIQTLQKGFEQSADISNSIRQARQQIIEAMVQRLRTLFG